MKVEEIERLMLEPLSPTPSCFLPLSQFDMKYIFHPYMQGVAFYPGSRSDAQNESLIQQARLSLSKVLLHFYPAAGRLALSSDGNSYGIDCNAAGVEWTVARADLPLDNLDYSQPSPDFSALIRSGKYGSSAAPLGSPLLSIQVTRFSCGGISVAWAADHTLADGTGRVHFLVSWAESCLKGEISQVPRIDRDLGPQQLDYPRASDFSPVASGHDPPKSGNIAMSGRIFCFERDYIDKLKEMAGVGLSRFTVLCAHIWINMCAARDLPDSTSTTNSMAANCRKRLAPQLPDEFFGNAVLHAVATTTAGELRKGGLRHAASLLEDAVSTSFGMEGITKKLSSKGIGADKLGKNCNMLCSSSPRFRYYEIDLGWGRPEAVRHVGLERLGLDGLCMFNPHPRSPQGIEVTITLPTGTLERLRRLLEAA